MLREIKKKMVILNNRMPFGQDTKSYFAETERNAWVYNNMKLEGSALSKERTVRMLSGELLLDIPAYEHIMAQNLETILRRVYSLASLKSNLDLRLIDELHSLITGEERGTPYRRRSIIISEWDYTPVIAADIPAHMQQLKKTLDKASKAESLSEDCFECCAEIHNKLLEILPYGEKDKILARTTATYYMITKGYPAMVFDIKEQEYNEMAANYMKTKDCAAFKELFKKEILNRLNLMIQLTAY